MPDLDHRTPRQQLAWRIAAQWLVVLALGLGVVGMILALLQTRSLAVRLMAPAEAQARHIAEMSLRQFERELANGLDVLASYLRSRPGPPWQTPTGFPTWLDGLYAWDGTALQVIQSPPELGETLSEAVRARLAARWPPLSEQPARPFEVLYDLRGETPVVLGCAESAGSDGKRLLIAGHINLQRLRADLVEPLLYTDAGLEIVPAQAGRQQPLWSQRLFSAMRYWQIRPTRAFVREQEKTVLEQTAVYLGLTVLALATLLVAMWVLARAARRELALTEMKANFVADVSHELKTPLALIRLFGETLQSGRVGDEEKRQEYYEIITRESTRLTNLINNILDFARIEAGRKEYVLQTTDVAEVVRETYEAYRAQLDHDGFEHHLTATPLLPPVAADADAIAQALINLINNAIKYSGEERFLSIDVGEDTRRGRRGVLISVHDRGIGIRPEDRAHLFDGFFRAGDTRVRNRGGTGLGLALVKHIVDSHHGSLDVESRLVKGSTFRIFLPSAEAPEPTVRKVAAKEPAGLGADQVDGTTARE